MQILLTESQLKMLVVEYYDSNQIYVRENIIKELKRAPGYIKQYMRKLPRFYVRDENGEPYKDNMGNKVIFTKIPEIVYNFIHGNF